MVPRINRHGVQDLKQAGIDMNLAFDGDKWCSLLYHLNPFIVGVGRNPGPGVCVRARARVCVCVLCN